MKHIHFIGICGVAMSALAISFKEQGWKVTGSDAGFYPPISTHLEENHVDFYAGWHPEKMGKPDIVCVGNVVSSFNPEWVYIKENQIPYKSYPEIIGEYFVKPESIVCAGTYGKTTSTALLTWVFLNSGKNPSYMFGGLSQNKLPAAHLTDSQWSILEGDEYKSARWDLRPKFAHYETKHLLLTAVIWDHADIYKTEKDYRNAFQKLADGIPEDGTLVVSERVDNIKLPTNPPLPRPLQKAGTASGELRRSLITYGKNGGCEYSYGKIEQNTSGLNFVIKHGSEEFKIFSPCLGEYMADNITGCFALAVELGLEPNQIIESIKTFVGMKRRLEKRLSGPVTVIDDIAHSPAKAQSLLKTLRQIYHEQKIIAVFEPNTGNRRQEAIPGYDGAFSEADEVVIPRLTKIKKDDNTKTRPLTGEELTTIISQTQPNVTYIDEDTEVVRYLRESAGANSVIAFLGSHGFRGMIEEMVKQLSC